jgi:hypothetical protein
MGAQVGNLRLPERREADIIGLVAAPFMGAPAQVGDLRPQDHHGADTFGLVAAPVDGCPDAIRNRP